MEDRDRQDVKQQLGGNAGPEIDRLSARDIERLKTILEWGWKIEYANLTVTTAHNLSSSTSPGPAYELRDSDGDGFYDTLVINTHDPGAFGMYHQAATSTVAERLSQGIWDGRITSHFVGRPLEDPIAEGMAAAWDEMAHRSSRGVVGMGNGAIGGTASGMFVGGAIGSAAGLLGTLVGAGIGGVIGGISGAFTGFLHGYSNPGMSDKQLKHESLGLGLGAGFSAAPVIANSIASSARVVTIGATGENATGGIRTPSGLPPISPPTNRGGLRKAMGDPPAGMTKPNAHHDLPWKFRDWFAQRGLNVNDPRFGRWVEGTPPGGHQNWSAAFEAEWRQFKLDNPDATADEVIAFMNSLRNDPRFQ